MEVLVLRLVLPLLTMLLVTAAQRRFGHRLGGRLVGLPLTSCPLLLVLLLTDGAGVAAGTAAGMAAGQAGVAVFCFAYGRLADRLRGPLLVTVTALALAAGALVAVSVIRSTAVVFALVAVLAVAGLRVWEPVAATGTRATAAVRWETPLRVVVTVTVVACLSGAVKVLGPHLAGVLAGIPVVLAVLAPLTQRGSGARAAAALTRGVLRSVPGTLAFVVALAFGLPWLGAAAFGVAAGALVLADCATGRFLVTRAREVAVS
ncbi:hypothetical protein [Amycolatopsis sp. CA-230715]|uniref:hypothetical protein n=1 Tax=Amycolatopsis sp. CA-230715 TaxID=2745196 RepID=UPI001C00ACFD|nr:hypothetical protein [Amycolatopsis sp. CA-230715]QWF80939.1 hypothetical protein HUW46_04364 [Amycolatopsis sp. CA-230715]